jgi:hypothetical protein
MSEGSKLGRNLFLLVLGLAGAVLIYYLIVFHESPAERRQWRIDNAKTSAKEAGACLEEAAGHLASHDYPKARAAHQKAAIKIDALSAEVKREAQVEAEVNVEQYYAARLARFEEALLAECDAQLGKLESDPFGVARRLNQLSATFPKSGPLKARLDENFARLDAARIAAARNTLYVIVRQAAPLKGAPKVDMDSTRTIEKALRARWPADSKLRLAMQSPASEAERAVAWGVIEAVVRIRAVSYNVRIGGRSSGPSLTGLPMEVAVDFKLRKPGRARTSWDRLPRVHVQKPAPTSIRGRGMWSKLREARLAQENALNRMIAVKLKAIPEFRQIGN